MIKITLFAFIYLRYKELHCYTTDYTIILSSCRGQNEPAVLWCDKKMLENISLLTSV